MISWQSFQLVLLSFAAMLLWGCGIPDSNSFKGSSHIKREILNGRVNADDQSSNNLSKKLENEVETLIQRLGADTHDERQLADARLRCLGDQIVPILKRHLDTDEPEILERLEQIIAWYDGRIVIPELDLELVPIKAGKFQMGSSDKSKKRLADERYHEVVLETAFWMGRTEVTQGQFRKVMRKNDNRPFKGDSFPVERVTWGKAVEFCYNLTQRERLAKRLPMNEEYRLPTEAEWEYCCRAGSVTEYSFGDEDGRLRTYAWYEGNSKGSRPVATRLPNAWGLYDMHGNVWEWCGDWYSDKYNVDLNKSPTGPIFGEKRVCRGGSWNAGAFFCRSAYRCSHGLDFWSHDVGFRIVRATIDGAKREMIRDIQHK